jgi:hypothetical protein
MATGIYDIYKLNKPNTIRQSSQLNPPKVDDNYFDKLAAFGLACLAAAIVGKLIMTALTPKKPDT